MGNIGVGKQGNLLGKHHSNLAKDPCVWGQDSSSKGFRKFLDSAHILKEQFIRCADVLIRKSKEVEQSQIPLRI